MTMSIHRFSCNSIDLKSVVYCYVTGSRIVHQLYYQSAGQEERQRKHLNWSSCKFQGKAWSVLPFFDKNQLD